MQGSIKVNDYARKFKHQASRIDMENYTEEIIGSGKGEGVAQSTGLIDSRINKSPISSLVIKTLKKQQTFFPRHLCSPDANQYSTAQCKICTDHIIHYVKYYARGGRRYLIDGHLVRLG